MLPEASRQGLERDARLHHPQLANLRKLAKRLHRLEGVGEVRG